MTLALGFVRLSKVVAICAGGLFTGIVPKKFKLLSASFDHVLNPPIGKKVVPTCAKVLVVAIEKIISSVTIILNFVKFVLMIPFLII